MNSTLAFVNLNSPLAKDKCHSSIVWEHVCVCVCQREVLILVMLNYSDNIKDTSVCSYMENLTDYCKLCIIEAHATSLMFICSVSLLREHAMVSVGFCVVSTVKRAYPLEDATHIALSNFCFEIKHHI